MNQVEASCCFCFFAIRPSLNTAVISAPVHSQHLRINDNGLNSCSFAVVDAVTGGLRNARCRRKLEIERTS